MLCITSRCINQSYIKLGSQNVICSQDCCIIKLVKTKLLQNVHQYMAFLAATVCQQNSHAKSRTEKWDRVQRRASRMIKRLRHMKNWERLRKWIHLAYRSPREESNYRLQLPYRKFPKSESQTLLQRCAMKGQEARSQNRIWEVPAKGGTKSGEKKKGVPKRLWYFHPWRCSALS